MTESLDRRIDFLREHFASILFILIIAISFLYFAEDYRKATKGVVDNEKYAFLGNFASQDGGLEKGIGVGACACSLGDHICNIYTPGTAYYNFSTNVAASSLTIPAGGSGQTSITTTFSGNELGIFNFLSWHAGNSADPYIAYHFVSTTTLTTQLQSWLTFNFSPSPCPFQTSNDYGGYYADGTCTATLTISVAPGATPGTYPLRIFGDFHPSQSHLNESCCGDNLSLVITPAGSPAPTADIRANGGNGPLTIAQGSSANISWTSTNATSCNVSPTGWTGTNNGGTSVTINSNTTYLLTCSGPGGQTTDSVTVNITSIPNPTATITANGSGSTITVPYGQFATIAWNSTNAASCTVSPINGTGTGGSQSITITGSDDYRVDCVGTRPGTTATDQVRVNVSGTPGNAPTVNLRANGSDNYVSVPYNSSVNVTWTSTNSPTSCSVSPSGWTGINSPPGGYNQTLISDRTYTITCTKSGFPNATDSVFVDVGNPGPPVITFTATSPVAYNGSTNLNWNTTGTGPISCAASGDWSGSKSSSGSEVRSGLTSNKVYTLSCTGPGGTDTETRTVVVTPPAGPSVNLDYSDAPDPISYNGRTTLTWTTSNAISCSAAGGPWSGSKSIPSGSETTARLVNNTIYILQCTGLGGTTGIDSITIPVEAATECSDGIDNDGDGHIDTPDRACTGPSDDSEGFCGDGICEQASIREFDQGETPFSCPADCIQPNVEEQ
jgi:hypothetical protein